MRLGLLGPVNFGKWGKRENPSYEHHWWTMTGKYTPIYLRKKKWKKNSKN